MVLSGFWRIKGGVLSRGRFGKGNAKGSDEINWLGGKTTAAVVA
jgi:hypothetical protein